MDNSRCTGFFEPSHGSNVKKCFVARLPKNLLLHGTVAQWTQQTSHRSRSVWCARDCSQWNGFMPLGLSMASLRFVRSHVHVSFGTRLGTRVGRTVWNVFPHFHFFRCTFGNCVAFYVIVFSKLSHSSASHFMLLFSQSCHTPVCFSFSKADVGKQSNFALEAHQRERLASSMFLFRSASLNAAEANSCPFSLGVVLRGTNVDIKTMILYTWMERIEPVVEFGTCSLINYVSASLKVFGRRRSSLRASR